MAIVGEIQTGTSWNDGASVSWSKLADLTDTSSSFGGLPVSIGLSWRKYGTTGGGPENFSADGIVNGVLSGNRSIAGNNSITVSGMSINLVNRQHIVTQPGTNVVGATMRWRFGDDDFIALESRDNNSPVGSSYTSAISRSKAVPDITAAASTTSGAVRIMICTEDATGSHLSLWLRVVNYLIPDYRPGQDRVSGVWESHNRSAGRADIRSGGAWVTMRTQDGGSGTGNPPLIHTGGSWINQRKIGANQ